MFAPASETITKDNGRKKSLFSKGKQSLSRAMYQAAKFGGFRSQGSDRKGNSNLKYNDGNDIKVVGDEFKPVHNMNEPARTNIPDISEPSVLLSEKTRSALYLSLPALVQGRKWVLLYRCRKLYIFLVKLILELQIHNKSTLVYLIKIIKALP